MAVGLGLALLIAIHGSPDHVYSGGAWQGAPRPLVISGAISGVVGSQPGEMNLALDSGGKTETFSISPPEVLPRLTAVGVVGAAPRGTIPEGAEVRITGVASDVGFVVTAVERRTGQLPAAGATLRAEAEGYELTYALRYFDFDGVGLRDMSRRHLQRRAEFYITARRIAAHSRSWEDRFVWFRGRADYLLAVYANRKNAEAITRREAPALLGSVGALEDVLRRFGTEIIVTKSLLAQPEGSTDHPIGGWLSFPVVVYLEGAGGSPTELVNLEHLLVKELNP